LRTNEPPTILVGKEWQGGRLAYEPTRKEIYTPTRFRGEAIAVYDADTGKRTADLKLPGYRVTALEAVPGKVFFSVENRSGLYVIDAATHTVAPWPINGKLVTPAFIEADPAGQYLFGQYERHVVAIDIRTATVVADLTTTGVASIAFDPETRLLVVAAGEIPDHPRVVLKTYSVSANGFTLVANLKNTLENEGSVYSMHGGFLQRGHHSLFLWLAAPTR
jgi:DNA-binding beta-propeller fold protein YncE